MVPVAPRGLELHERVVSTDRRYGTMIGNLRRAARYVVRKKVVGEEVEQDDREALTSPSPRTDVRGRGLDGTCP